MVTNDENARLGKQEKSIVMMIVLN